MVQFGLGLGAKRQRHSRHRGPVTSRRCFKPGAVVPNLRGIGRGHAYMIGFNMELLDVQKNTGAGRRRIPSPALHLRSVRTVAGVLGKAASYGIAATPRRSTSALRPVARPVVQLPGNKRYCRLRSTIERPNRILCIVKPLADVSTISYAILCFEFFRSHQRSKVYLGAAIAAAGVAHVFAVMRHLCIIGSSIEENSTGSAGLTFGSTDRGSRLRRAKEGVDDSDESASFVDNA
jgi:hypothetical protein